jgi:Protein of unknown function (DUF2889)
VKSAHDQPARVARAEWRAASKGSKSARPHVLPFPECQWAPEHVTLLTGRHVTTFRTDVQSTLTELQACTHLNDMLRCLAEVPTLAATIS